jgi:hypothetical protein
VKYKTDQPLDHDIITTHKNLKAAEKTAGEKPQAKDADKGKEK